ncbi:MAG TPA: serine/threonine-protein kinase, partial [Thermoanaerobaculia bacterium]|nr:serine/threonine-protein kinase [Thermoanaerobaculia bacterium]
MPDRIGHYTIVSQLGRGGMGVVYKAHEESLNRFVAIKLLGEHLLEDEIFVSRFVREAQSAASLSHPNIVQIYFIGQDEGRPYFVMEHVSGRSLQRLIRERGRIENPQAAQMILQAAHGLAAAHDKGIIHRDIKPGNLMLDERGLVKIADFGLALPSQEQNRLTATGLLMGTPGYLAPEQCRGEQADHRTDIYALGVTWFEILTGTAPFKADSPLLLLKQILEDDPPEIATLNPEVDGEARRILGRMLAKDRTQRYQSCHELAADLEEYIAARGVRSATAGLATLTAAGVRNEEAATTVLSDVAPPTAAASLPQASAPRTAAGSGGVATVPDPPLQGPATQVTAANAAPAGARANRLPLIAAILVLLAGGGGVAAFLGWKALSRGADLNEPAAAAASVAAPSGSIPETNAARNDARQLSAPITPLRGLDEGSSGKLANRTERIASAEAAAESGRAEDHPEPVADARSTPRSSRSDSSDPRPAGPEPRDAEPGRTLALSGVGVAVVGDESAIQGPVNEVLIAKLIAGGNEVTDLALLPETASLLRSRDPSAAALSAAARDEGLALLVLARIEPAGQRELRALGRSDTAYSSRITVVIYNAATGRPVGTTKSGSLEYTSLNAEREAKQVILPLA